MNLKNTMKILDSEEIEDEDEEKNPQNIWRKNKETLGGWSGWRRMLGGAMKKNTSDAGRFD